MNWKNAKIQLLEELRKAKRKNNMDFTKEEDKIIRHYAVLAEMNPNVKTMCDKVVYIFVKIMFEHPLLDGNKRLATKVLLQYLGVDEIKIDTVCESLAKENA